MPPLEAAVCDNKRLLTALRSLCTFLDHGVRRRVNYAALDVEELGSVYESLLEYHPYIDLDDERPFRLSLGSERKQTGTFYTPRSLVQQVVDDALVPVMSERLAAVGHGTREEKAQAMLSIKVCDTSAGSGHFVLAAARRLARELARVRHDEVEPSPEHYREALREVIRTCIYAVDKNVLATDLCKVALWIEGHNTDKPLSFLDNHVKCGDSLVGVVDLDVLTKAIPEGAYAPVGDDARPVATAYKRRNAIEEKQQSLPTVAVEPAAAFSADFSTLTDLNDDTPVDVHAKERIYSGLRAQATRWWRIKTACDLWTAAFFSPLTCTMPTEVRNDPVPTTEILRSYLAGRTNETAAIDEAVRLAGGLGFFHWPLEFPEVFEQGGFDVLLGNPPWERIKLQEEEFFASRDPEIAWAQNKAERGRLIKALPERNLALYNEFVEAKRRAEAQSKFIRGSGRYPVCGRGDINTYAVFAETIKTLLGPRGRAGFIVPTGIATDDRTKYFFQALMDSRALVSLYDFENKGIFPGVHSSYKFSLLTLTGAAQPARHGAQFSFFAHAPLDLRRAERRFTLSAEDIARLNPNTRTCPVFRSKRDADLTKAIYRRVPVLENEVSGENPWGVSFLRMFDMSNDSHLFRTYKQLRADGWTLNGNAFHEGNATYLPLYEAKLLHQFDHRFGTYDHGETHDLTDSEKAAPYCTVMPRYWVPAMEVDERLAGKWKHRWMLGFRNITNVTNERTAIFSLLPLAGVGHSAPIMFLDATPPQVSCFLATACSRPFDYLVRQKLGGTNMTYGYIRQFASLPPAAYTPAHIAYITPRVLELVYTAWDMDIVPGGGVEQGGSRPRPGGGARGH